MMVDEDGNVLSDSEWTQGPETLQDIFTGLGSSDPVKVRELMKTPQWEDFPLSLRREVEAWLADRPTPSER